MPNLDETLASLDQLKGSIEQDSCITKKPFMELESNPDGSSVPQLKYNIPQATCYPVTAGINLNIAGELFKTIHREVPDNNFYDVMTGKSVDEVREVLDVRVSALPRQHLLADAGELQVVRATLAPDFPVVEETAVEGEFVKAPNLVVREDNVFIKAEPVSFVNALNLVKAIGVNS